MESYSWTSIWAMCTFSVCSSTLLLVNKVCMHRVPAASFISTVQFIATGITCLTLKYSGLAVVDDFEWVKVKPYLYYVVMFVATIYCNMKSLEHSNVETIIVFRACCPLCVCLLDWACLGRELPSLRSLTSLVVLMAGAAGYVLSDREFKMQGFAAYTWVSAYFLIISVEMCYGKFIVGPHIGLKSMWGPTMYTNVLAILPMATAGLLAHEEDRLYATEWNSSLLSLLGLSCVIGVAISYTGWNCRSMITATCYTVLGVANKMATVLMNCLLWDKHASLPGICSLVVCLAGAASYQQAPVRAEKATAPSLSALCRSPTGLVFTLIVLAVGGGAVYGGGGSGGGGSGTVSSPPAMSSGLPMGAPTSGAVARLGKGGGAAQGSPKHGADGLEAWGKARNSHRSDSSVPHGAAPPSDASTHHVSPLRHTGDKAGRNRTYAARPTSSRSFSPRARLLRNRTLDDLGDLGGVPCNSTVRGDSTVKLCTKDCKPSKVQGQCKTCHCSSCSWCKK
jgi:drug/metabolite transporter (DMT)-like permease